MTITNTSLYSNTATSGDGGGIYNAGTLTMTNSTLSRNSAPTGSGGGIFNAASYTATLQNTIVANSPSGGNCGGTITDGGQNLQWNPNSGCGFILPSLDPKLAPLGNYGGPTQTMGLFVGSAAINAGADVNCPSIDQRGVTRPQGAQCDIGAFEGTLYPLYLPLIVR